MAQYFYSYIEYKKDGQWHLLYNPLNPAEPVTVITCGYPRDLLREGEWGTRIEVKEDPSYVPKPQEQIPGFENFKIPQYTYEKKRYVVDDYISPELENILNKEWDPDNEDNMFYNTGYYIITGEDITTKANELRTDALKRIQELREQQNTNAIESRLARIEDFVQMIADGSKPAKSILKKKETDPDDEPEDDSSYIRESIEYYENDVLGCDVPQLDALLGMLTGVSDILNLQDYDTSWVRFVACID